jgi:hypothetical protein
MALLNAMAHEQPTVTTDFDGCSKALLPFSGASNWQPPRSLPRPKSIYIESDLVSWGMNC